MNEGANLPANSQISTNNSRLLLMITYKFVRALEDIMLALALLREIRVIGSAVAINVTEAILRWRQRNMAPSAVASR